ncbi:MAG: hypothetical protein LBD02_10745 [Christensenellaceae bacterium]|jgi:hypothetical protein|nr:hypothetical protein [Christensenellaceae bacterium]
MPEPINLHERWSKRIEKEYRENGLVFPHLNQGAVASELQGVKTVMVSQLITVPYSDYSLSATPGTRYGEVSEVGDYVQEFTMTQQKSFNRFIEGVTNMDQQGLKSAARVIQSQIREQGVPSRDKYALSVLAHKGGMIVSNATALSKSNVIDRITDATATLNDKEVPSDGRTLYVPANVYKLIRTSDQFMQIEQMGNTALRKGQVGRLDNMAVVEIPASRWPASVNFIIVHKDAAIAGKKIDHTTAHTNPLDYYGTVIQHLEYYDVFVNGPKAVGIYVEVGAGGTVLAAPTINATTGVITGTGGTVWHTVDGSDPRYSRSAVPGAAPVIPIGQTVTVRAYVQAAAASDTTFSSAVATAQVTAAAGGGGD